jgi:hypothetical protein
MRIYVHYLAQYLYILVSGFSRDLFVSLINQFKQAQSTPLYGFDLRILFVSFRYSSASLSTGVEVGIVAIGPIACMCIFLLFTLFGHAFHEVRV